MKNRINICLAESIDLPLILDLQKECYRQEAEIYNDFNIPPMLQTLDALKIEWQNGTVLIAVKNGQIVGSVRALLDTNICKIGKLIVKPDFQNQGIGKNLMKAIEMRFNECLVYELFTGSESEKNLALYRKLGYRDCRKESVNQNMSLIFLQKQNVVTS